MTKHIKNVKKALAKVGLNKVTVQRRGKHIAYVFPGGVSIFASLTPRNRGHAINAVLRDVKRMGLIEAKNG